jgi:hypothetical protein
VQVDLIKPKLKPPGTERLKLEYDKMPSSFGFKFNMRRCNTVYLDDEIRISQLEDGSSFVYQRV